MSNRYDVERMLSRLVEDESQDNTSEKPVYSWQKDKDYRDKKTEDLSVDDIIFSIGTTKGKHEAVRKNTRNNQRRKNESAEHSKKQKIVYRSPEEIQEEVNRQDNIDSKEYLNRMLDRMEKEIAAMESPLKPKLNRTQQNTEVSKIPKQEKNIIKVKAKKKKESISENVVENSSEDFRETKDIYSENNIQDKIESDNIPDLEIPETSDNIIEDTENYDSFDDEKIKIEQEIKDFSENLLSDLNDISYISEEKTEPKKKKGFLSKLFSKRTDLKEDKDKDKDKDENEDGLIDFDEEEFNRKFDELSEQAKLIENDLSQEKKIPEEMEEDDYFFDEEESEKINLSDTNYNIENNNSSDEISYTENKADSEDYLSDEIQKEETENIEDLMDEDLVTKHDITESTENSKDDEEIFIESIKSDEKEIITEKKLKQKKYMLFGFFVTVFAVIGVITVVYFAGGALISGVHGSSVKSQIEKVVYPEVAEDMSAFDDISACNDSEIIGASLLNILMNKDLSSYSNKDNSIETYTIPSSDIEKSAVELFGSEVSIKEHQNVVIDEVTFYYDKVTNVYSVTAKPLIYTSKPYISKVTSDGDEYIASVLYMTDYPDWIEKKDSNQSYYSKICTYTLKRDENKNFYIISIEENEIQ